MLPLTGINVPTNMALQSTSHVASATVLAMSRQGIFFIPSILILPKIIGLLGVQIAQPASDGLTFLLTLYFFVRYLKKLKKKMGKQD